MTEAHAPKVWATHPVIYMRSAAILGVAGIFMLGALWQSASNHPIAGVSLFSIALVVTMFGLGALLASRRRVQRVMVSDTGVACISGGFINPSNETILFHAIDRVRVAQAWFGNLFHCGHLTIITMNGAVSFRYLRDPQQVRSEIESRHHDERD